MFKGKYRIRSARLQTWDYSSNGYYFVTICTKNRINHFGEIRNGIMGLNEFGCMAAKFWQEIPMHFENVELDEWVVMPNHIHGVIIINNPIKRRDRINPVSTIGFTTENNPMSEQSLGRIARWFKGRTAFEIRKSNGGQFAWQPRFYDRIIRNDDELFRIQEYIRNNPFKWESDRNNPSNYS